MTLGERIKKVRKALDLTQQEFADQIGTTRNNIAGYETGRREPSTAAISLIVTKLNVSEEWLRNGTEPMFCPSPESSIDMLVDEFKLGELEKQIILEFVHLDAKDRKGVIEYVQRLAQNKVLQTAQDKAAQKAAYMELAEKSYDSEQEPASQALSAKESDVG